MVPLRAGALNKSLVVNRSRSISSVKIFNISVGRKVLMSSFSRDQEQGRDSLGNTYQSRSEMWLLEAGETGSKVDNLKKEQWYKKGVEYWKVIFNGELYFVSHLFCVLVLCRTLTLQLMEFLVDTS